MQDAPLFEALGHFTAPGGSTRYFLKVGGEVRAFRGWQLANLGCLLEIVPDVDHWRSCHGRNGGKIDSKAAAAALIRECWNAGSYEPPQHLRPRPVGRPPK